jgi:hypothetical protein
MENAVENAIPKVAGRRARQWLRFPFVSFFGLLAIFLLWQMIVFLRHRPRGYTEAEQRAVAACSRSLAGALEGRLPSPAKLGVAHFVGDSRDEVTRAVREALADVKGFSVEQSSIIQRFLSDVSRAVAEATSLDEVLNAGRRVSLDVVVAGRVLDVSEREDGTGVARLQVWAYDVRDGKMKAAETVEGSWRPDVFRRMRAKVLSVSAVVRLIIWLAVVLALPWIARPATRWAVGRKSNAAAFAVLAAHVLVGVSLAFVLSGAGPAGFWGWTRFWGAFVFASVYSFWACDRIARAESRP